VGGTLPVGECVIQKRKWPEGEDRKFHIQRGVPLVPIVTFLFALAIQTVMGVRYISALEAEVKAQGKGQLELTAKVDKIEVKVDTLAGTVNQGNVPAALNNRAIADLERQLAALAVRVADSERRLATRER
jgi:hypothetical protein